MAKLKMLKLPKKPKKSASVATKEKYLAKVAEVHKENEHRKRQNARSIELDKRIASVGKTKSAPARKKTARKRKSAPKKKTAKRRRR